MLVYGSAKAALLEGFAGVGKALGNPARIELLDMLAQGERGVEDLAAVTGMRLSNTSAQLKALAAAGLVTVRRSGTHAYYRIADPRVTVLLELAKQLAHDRSPQVREAARAWLGETTGLEPVTRCELDRRIREGAVVVLDVRPAAEYAAAHVTGAMGIPLDELPGRLGELPRDAEIVAYCRGPYCFMSLHAVRLLRTHGYHARPMEGGLPQWRIDGLPTSHTSAA
jgi:rhodanese-related sulfurtransferase/predicted RNA binding protein YcfA (HicA-like mRNA interferase family)